MLNAENKLSILRQCELLEINRSVFYYSSRKDNETELCNLILEIYSNNPVYGYRRITAMLRHKGFAVNSKKVLRLMREMNLQAIYPKPKPHKKQKGAYVFPYLLGAIEINEPNQAWQIDITYLRVNGGFMYLVAFIDVYSRFVVAANLYNDLCASGCIRTLENAIVAYGIPEIINSDQGSQFTSEDWIKALKNYKIKISMTGKGRCCDNAYIERLWRSFKYEGSYLYEWRTVAELKNNLPKWLHWYNYQRPHQSLSYEMPVKIYYGFMDKAYALPTIPQYKQQPPPLFD